MEEIGDVILSILTSQFLTMFLGEVETEVNQVLSPSSVTWPSGSDTVLDLCLFNSC